MAKITGQAIADRLELYQYPGSFAGESLHRGCQYRFLQLNAFKEEYAEVLRTAFSERFDKNLEDFSSEDSKWLNAEENRLRVKHRIPEDVYLTTDDPIRDDHFNSYMDDLCGWVAGTLTKEESAEFVHDLDLDELDEYYILLEIPNFFISGKQRLHLENALIEVGCGYATDYTGLSEICERLRASDKKDGSLKKLPVSD